MIVKLLLRYKGRLLLAAVCYLSLVIMSSISPLFLSRLVDELAKGHDATIPNVLVSASFIVVSSVFAILIGFFLTKYLGRMSIDMSTEIRIMVTQCYLCSGKGQVPPSGDFLTNILRDTGKVVSFITKDVNSILITASSFLGISIIFMIMHMRLFLALIIFIPLYSLVYKFFATIRYQNARELRRTYSELSTCLSSTARHQRTVYLHRCQNLILEKIRLALLRHNEMEYKTVETGAWAGLSLSGLSFFMSSISLLLGAFFVVRGEVTVGMMLSFTTYSGKLLSPVSSLTELALSWQETKIAIENLEEYYVKEKDITRENSKMANLTDVTFNEVKPYNSDLTFDFCMKLAPVTSIIGPNGVGKSTICECLAGYLRPSDGRILFRLSSGRSVSPDHISSNIMIIDTHMELFEEETLLENITLGKEVTSEKLTEALALVELTSLIQERGIQLNQVVKSIGFSHGERQRILIARGLLWGGHLLILDEALSGIDLALSSRIIERLRTKFAQVIVVSHRETDHEKSEYVYHMGPDGCLMPTVPRDFQRGLSM